MNENALLAWLAQQFACDEDSHFGIGDDAALCSLESGQQLVVSTDTLVEHVHFSADVDLAALGHKLMAVNLSDIAAMGAVPRWVFINLTAPCLSEASVQALFGGIDQMAKQHGVRLMGGDTTQGPLTLSATLLGTVPQGQAVKRAGAQVGDAVFVVGVLGGAAWALRAGGSQQCASESCLQALHRPNPPVAFAAAARDMMHAAIDISDGLLLDVSRMGRASHVGIQLNIADLPCDPTIPQVHQWRCACYGGDEYTLCLTANLTDKQALQQLASQHQVRLTQIGVVTGGDGVVCLDDKGNDMQLEVLGWQHFVEEN